MESEYIYKMGDIVVILPVVLGIDASSVRSRASQTGVVVSTGSAGSSIEFSDGIAVFFFYREIMLATDLAKAIYGR